MKRCGSHTSGLPQRWSLGWQWHKQRKHPHQPLCQAQRRCGFRQLIRYLEIYEGSYQRKNVVIKELEPGEPEVLHRLFLLLTREHHFSAPKWSTSFSCGVHQWHSSCIYFTHRETELWRLNSSIKASWAFLCKILGCSTSTHHGRGSWTLLLEEHIAWSRAACRCHRGIANLLLTGKEIHLHNIHIFKSKNIFPQKTDTFVL